MVKTHRILIVTGALYHEESGPFLSVKEAAISIEKYSSQYAVTVIGTITPDENSRLSWYEGIDCLAFKRFGPRNFHISPSAVKWLRQNIPSFDFVIIQSLWSLLHLEAARISYSAKIPYMFVVRGNLNPQALKFSSLRKSIATWFYGTILGNASCYQALNDNEREMIRKFGINSPIGVIPNGLTPLPRRQDLKQDFNRQKIKMVYLGRINPIKGLDRLLSCLSGILECNTQWKFAIAGDDSGNYANYLKVKYKPLISKGHVCFVGSKFGDDKHQLLMESDLFILPSHSEGMPMAVLEAASIGLPCAITKNCGLQDLIVKGGAFLIRESEDDMFDDLANVLTKSPEELYMAGIKGRAHVDEHYAWQRIVAMYEELFDWLRGTDSEKPEFVDDNTLEGYKL